ncbi:hypothetical protein G6541_27470 [Streptomyces albidoflavus]|nr:hypothetical protein [Streptomyces albidoflavus]
MPVSSIPNSTLTSSGRTARSPWATDLATPVISPPSPATWAWTRSPARPANPASV